MADISVFHLQFPSLSPHQCFNALIAYRSVLWPPKVFWSLIISNSALKSKLNSEVSNWEGIIWIVKIFWDVETDLQSHLWSYSSGFSVWNVLKLQTLYLVKHASVFLVSNFIHKMCCYKRTKSYFGSNKAFALLISAVFLLYGCAPLTTEPVNEVKPPSYFQQATKVGVHHYLNVTTCPPNMVVYFWSNLGLIT